MEARIEQMQLLQFGSLIREEQCASLKPHILASAHVDKTPHMKDNPTPVLLFLLQTFYAPQ
jgi:hypothetical protein